MNVRAKTEVDKHPDVNNFRRWTPAIHGSLIHTITRRWLVQHTFTVVATTIVAGAALALLLNRIKRDHAL